MLLVIDRLKESLQKNSTVILKYALVGCMGTLIDIGGLFVLVNYFKFPVLLAATISFLLAVTNNYIFNKNWTFQSRSSNNRKLFLKFVIVHLVGLLINLSGMFVLVNLFAIWYIFAKIFVTAFVLTWNFLANKLWTFRVKTVKSINSQNNFFLSIVIPAFNERMRIGNTICAIQDYLARKNILAEIIVVDDGSNDGTGDFVKSFSDNIRLISLSKNQGKGFAIKKGIEVVKGEYVLFTDADNSTPIEEFDKFLDIIGSNMDNFDILIGSRYLKRNSVLIKQSKYRIFISRLGNFFIQLFLLDGVKDTQCGFKLFKSSVAKDIFSFQKVKRFGFDIEAIVVAKNLGYTFTEIPVAWMNVEGSRLRPVKDVLITAKDLIYIKLNLWSGRYKHD